ncbi:MAG: glycosyltransferase [Planctomycetes bacterium]|nr:glycosyltransferase [Planctomycetota bacterium]
MAPQSRPIPIALGITDLEVGGAERMFVELATRLDRDRFFPVVYCLSPQPARSEDSLLPLLEEAGVETHLLGARRWWEIRRVVRAMERLLVCQSPQILQTFLFHANLVGRLAARRAGVPCVVSGIRVAEPRFSHRLLDRLTQRRVDCHVCVSDRVREFSQRRTRLPADKLIVIPNGIDVRRYQGVAPVDRASLGIAPDRRLITLVGRLEPQKGVGWLLKTAPTWLPRLPDHDLLLVGEGRQRTQLARWCDSRGITSRVHFAGFRRDIPEILAASELLVLPSRWEGMPNVVLEAMASALPVLATDVHGVRQLLGPRAEPQIVTPGDRRMLAEKLIRLCTDRPWAKKIGAENARRVEQSFSIDAMVSGYQRLWGSLLGEPRP